MLRKNHIGIQAAPSSAITTLPTVRLGAPKMASGTSGSRRTRWMTAKITNSAPLRPSRSAVRVVVTAGSLAVTMV